MDECSLLWGFDSIFRGCTRTRCAFVPASIRECRCRSSPCVKSNEFQPLSPSLPINHSPASVETPCSVAKVDAFVIKSSELDFKPVKNQNGKIKQDTVGPWACERHECTGDMQLQTFRKGAGDNLLTGISMKVIANPDQILEIDTWDQPTWPRLGFTCTCGRVLDVQFASSVVTSSNKEAENTVKSWSTFAYCFTRHDIRPAPASVTQVYSFSAKDIR